jgi:hypothetical protein
MKRSRFSEEQIIAILKEHEAGIATADVWRCRRAGVRILQSMKRHLRTMDRTKSCAISPRQNAASRSIQDAPSKCSLTRNRRFALRHLSTSSSHSALTAVKVRSRQNTPLQASKQVGGLPGIACCLALGVLGQLPRIARTLPGHCGGLEQSASPAYPETIKNRKQSGDRQYRPTVPV